MKRKFMIVMFVSTIAMAVQASAATWPDACGKDAIQFKVKTSKKQGEPVAPEAGKALIVFSESLSGDFASGPVVRFGVDGAWVGANKGASYFAVSVAPGEHHICSVRQSGAKADKQDFGEVKLDAQAGGVYYYDFKITRTEVGTPKERGGGGLPGTPHDMIPADSETVDSVAFTVLSVTEGRNFMSASPQSSSTAK